MPADPNPPGRSGPVSMPASVSRQLIGMIGCVIARGPRRGSCQSPVGPRGAVIPSCGAIAGGLISGLRVPAALVAQRSAGPRASGEGRRAVVAGGFGIATTAARGLRVFIGRGLIEVLDERWVHVV